MDWANWCSSCLVTVSRTFWGFRVIGRKIPRYQLTNVMTRSQWQAFREAVPQILFSWPLVYEIFVGARTVRGMIHLKTPLCSLNLPVETIWTSHVAMQLPSLSLIPSVMLANALLHLPPFTARPRWIWGYDKPTEKSAVLIDSSSRLYHCINIGDLR